MNRLQHETSPYLLQHKDNPVDWYPWGQEALAVAQSADKPILLSVGYSACHWCHVMAHESFEDWETAQIMNELFVNVKVDREERPDIDDIYMQAVQALSGRGGWPMTVFLTPQGRPFYGGTYYPKQPRYGMPSFQQVLLAVHDAYTNRRVDVDRAAEGLTESLSRDTLNIGGQDGALSVESLSEALEQLLPSVDLMAGGFGDAPKFPQPMALEFLLRSYVRTGDKATLYAAEVTLERMARGGIYDQLGGGFARYSVDAVWLVPHFEKMLYDNAQLSRVYLHAWQLTGNPFYRQIAEQIYDYILREMTAPEGGFYSATDADSEGEEGKFFVWELAELERLLGEDAPLMAAYWGVSAAGNFEGKNILNVPQDAADVAAQFGIPVADLLTKVEAARATLYAERAKRIAPALDDKILASWNGMMLASLAEGARVLQQPRYLEAAVRCAEFLRDVMLTPEARVYRTAKGSVSKLNGYLEDYANLIDAFLEVYQSTFDEQWFTLARRLSDVALEQFLAADGAFYDTSADHETLVVRPRNLQDNATPAGNTMMAKQLVRLAAYTGEPRYDEATRGVLRVLIHAMTRYPQAFAEALNALDMLAGGVAEVALVGDATDVQTLALLRVLAETYRPNVIVALGAPNAATQSVVPLLHERSAQNNQPTAYVCRHFVCQLPVTTPAALAERLANP